MRIVIGLNQIASASSPQEIKGLSIAIKQEAQTMMMWASKLSQESINYLGRVSYTTELEMPAVGADNSDYNHETF